MLVFSRRVSASFLLFVVFKITEQDMHTNPSKYMLFNDFHRKIVLLLLAKSTKSRFSWNFETWSKIMSTKSPKPVVKPFFAHFENLTFLYLGLQKIIIFLVFGGPHVMEESSFCHKIIKKHDFSEKTHFFWYFVKKRGALNIPKVRYQWQSALKTVKPYQIWYGLAFPTGKS